MLPLTGPAVHVAPPVATQVHVGLVSAAGTVSATTAPLAAVGPALVPAIVYVIVWPGEAVVCPSVFAIDRSATGNCS